MTEISATIPDATDPKPGLPIRVDNCQCGNPVFFINSTCLACNTPLGYHPERARMLSLSPGAVEGTWVEWQTDGPAFVHCVNQNSPAGCNWLLPAEQAQAHNGLCRSCRLNQTIPDLNDPQHPENGELWGRIEAAKRRVVSSLLVMGLPVASKVTEDPERGMLFDFLRAPVGGPAVMTGHDTGLITIDIAEADHALRESARENMNEPYRTVLGHFRHEVGHYYWNRLVAGTQWHDPFRALFGDETQDYAASLQQHYANGPRPDWPQHFVSAYASSHPWEDWAECWAHYMHMSDTVDTANSYGLVIEQTRLEFRPFNTNDLYRPDDPQAGDFLAFLNHWAQLTVMLNGMSRAMGQPDFYPFVLPHEVVAKLQFVHLVVKSTRNADNTPA